MHCCTTHFPFSGYTSNFRSHLKRKATTRVYYMQMLFVKTLARLKSNAYKHNFYDEQYILAQKSVKPKAAIALH